jgi:hypothetical protein
MLKPPKDDPRRNIVFPWEDSDWSTIRNAFYWLPLTYADRLLNTTDDTNIPSWIAGRDRELFLPLFRLAAIIDNEGGLDIQQDLINVAREVLSNKGESFETDTILEVLANRLGSQNEIIIRPFDLIGDLELKLNRRGIRPEWISGRLRSLGSEKLPRGSQGVRYKITAQHIAEMLGTSSQGAGSTNVNQPYTTTYTSATP